MTTNSNDRNKGYDNTLVQRTVYLKKEMDNAINVLAFQQSQAKNEVISELLAKALAKNENTVLLEFSEVTMSRLQKQADIAGVSLSELLEQWIIDALVRQDASEDHIPDLP